MDDKTSNTELTKRRRKTFEEEEEARRDSVVRLLEVIEREEKLGEMDHWNEDEDLLNPALMEKRENMWKWMTWLGR